MFADLGTGESPSEEIAGPTKEIESQTSVDVEGNKPPMDVASQVEATSISSPGISVADGSPLPWKPKPKNKERMVVDGQECQLVTKSWLSNMEAKLSKYGSDSQAGKQILAMQAAASDVSEMVSSNRQSRSKPQVEVELKDIAVPCKLYDSVVEIAEGPKYLQTRRAKMEEALSRDLMTVSLGDFSHVEELRDMRVEQAKVEEAERHAALDAAKEAQHAQRNFNYILSEFDRMMQAAVVIQRAFRKWKEKGKPGLEEIRLKKLNRDPNHGAQKEYNDLALGLKPAARYMQGLGNERKPRMKEEDYQKMIYGADWVSPEEAEANFQAAEEKRLRNEAEAEAARKAAVPLSEITDPMEKVRRAMMGFKGLERAVTNRNMGSNALRDMLFKDGLDLIGSFATASQDGTVGEVLKTKVSEITRKRIEEEAEALRVAAEAEEAAGLAALVAEAEAEAAAEAAYPGQESSLEQVAEDSTEVEEVPTKEQKTEERRHPPGPILLPLPSSVAQHWERTLKLELAVRSASNGRQGRRYAGLAYRKVQEMGLTDSDTQVLMVKKSYCSARPRADNKSHSAAPALERCESPLGTHKSGGKDPFGARYQQQAKGSEGRLSPGIDCVTLVQSTNQAGSPGSKYGRSPTRNAGSSPTRRSMNASKETPIQDVKRASAPAATSWSSTVPTSPGQMWTDLHGRSDHLRGLIGECPREASNRLSVTGTAGSSVAGVSRRHGSSVYRLQQPSPPVPLSSIEKLAGALTRRGVTSPTMSATSPPASPRRKALPIHHARMQQQDSQKHRSASAPSIEYELSQALTPSRPSQPSLMSMPPQAGRSDPSSIGFLPQIAEASRAPVHSFGGTPLQHNKEQQLEAVSWSQSAGALPVAKGAESPERYPHPHPHPHPQAHLAQRIGPPPWAQPSAPPTAFGSYVASKTRILLENTKFAQNAARQALVKGSCPRRQQPPPAASWGRQSVGSGCPLSQHAATNSEMGGHTSGALPHVGFGLMVKSESSAMRISAAGAGAGAAGGPGASIQAGRKYSLSSQPNMKADPSSIAWQQCQADGVRVIPGLTEDSWMSSQGIFGGRRLSEMDIDSVFEERDSPKAGNTKQLTGRPQVPEKAQRSNGTGEQGVSHTTQPAADVSEPSMAASVQDADERSSMAYLNAGAPERMVNEEEENHDASAGKNGMNQEALDYEIKSMRSGVVIGDVGSGSGEKEEKRPTSPFIGWDTLCDEDTQAI